MKKALVIRYGAYGDALIVTPVLRELKKQGYYIIANVSDKTAVIWKENPNVDEFIFHDKDFPIDKLEDHWKGLVEEHKPDLFLNFSESIECNLALSPNQSAYNYPKEERKALCDKNYYEETFNWANMAVPENINPEVYFDDTELAEAHSYTMPDKFNILWCMSGSNSHKAYPWTPIVIDAIFRHNKNIHMITIGDEKCQKIETRKGKSITNLCGKTSMRISMALTGIVDLVISPDTGVLHASGCYTTPKIGLLGHTNIENITKHFENDYSVESKSSCAPCFRLVYDHTWQCPVDMESTGAVCQARGIHPEEVLNKIQEVIDGHGNNDTNT